VGEAFTAATLALQVGDGAGLEALLALAEAAPGAAPGIASAFGWVDPGLLRGVVLELLRSSSEVRRLIGVWAFALHRVDPRGTWPQLLTDASPRVRARAFRMAGEVGGVGQIEACLAGLNDGDEACRTWAAWSAVLLGDRAAALTVLMAAAERRPRGAAFDLVLQALPPDEAHAWLKRLAGRSTDLRALLRGSGRVGDPAYVPWLLSQLAAPAAARLAGESFTLITGADLRERPLNAKAPAGFEPGPNDDPEDPEVEMDPEADLPWPDAQAVAQWWTEARERLPAGRRLLLGAPPTPEHLATVLADGTQRQRALAASALALQAPGRPLFDVGAPAARQQVPMPKG